MSLDPTATGASSAPKPISWNARDCMLYALGVGAGVEDLSFTTNNTDGVQQRMLPTMPVTLGVDFSVLKAAGKIDWTRLLHAEQSIEILGDIPVEGDAIATSRIVEMWDKERAALVVVETEGATPAGQALWRSRASLFIKGAGGWGGERGPGSTGRADTPHPEATLTYTTRPDQALLYRLSGDYNPLHSDPAFARKAGLESPILHGLCTFGFAGRGVLAYAGGDPSSIRSLTARFAAPVWPGDTLHVDLWGLADDRVGFQVRGRGDEVVLTGGEATLVASAEAQTAASSHARA
jgi:acyl dehydratase